MAGVIAVVGHTYPVRQRLTQLGARWDPARKAWVIAGAGMNRTPYRGEVAKVAAVERAIRDEHLTGVRVEWMR